MVRQVPQPGDARMVEPRGRPLVVGVVPGQPALVLRTAAAWAAATGGALHCAYADPSRHVVEEHPDGSVRHAPVDADADDDGWRSREADLRAACEEVLAGTGATWHVRYLAGRPDRALTHLARAVDAAAFVVGTRAPGAGARMREMVEGSVAVGLARHQHRPVLVVPLRVVDWAERAWR